MSRMQFCATPERAFTIDPVQQKCDNQQRRIGLLCRRDLAMQTMLDQNPQHAAWSLRAARRAVVAAAIVCLGSLTGVVPAEKSTAGRTKTAAKPLPPPPWIVNGRVTDEAGRPIEGAEVRVNAGMGTLGCTGITETDRDGRYFVVGPGILGPDVQSAIVHASTPGRTDLDSGRQGFFTAALKPVQKSRHVDPARLLSCPTSRGPSISCSFRRRRSS